MKITKTIESYKKRANHIIKIATTKDGDMWRDDIPSDLIEAFEFIDDFLEDF